MEAKFLMNLQYYEAKPRNWCSSLEQVGAGQCLTHSTFSGSVSTPFADTICPKYFTLCLNRWHLLGLILSPAFLSRWNMSLSRWKCSSTVRLKMITSSEHTRHIVQCSPARTACISLWKVLGALHSPNGMTRNLVESKRSSECSLLTIALFDFNLPVPTSKNQG